MSGQAVSGTQGLIGLLTEWEKIVPPWQFKVLLEDTEAKVAAWIKRIKDLPEGVKRVKFVNRELDAALVRDREKRATHEQGSEWNRVKCRKGCNACCGMQVVVAPSEARRLAALVNSGRVEVDREKLARQAAVPRDAGIWWNQGPEARRCVFLQADGLCGVYAERPTECRKYYVLSDPALCGAAIGTRVAVYACLEAEIIASAFYTLEPNSEVLAVGVHRRLMKRKGDKP